MPDVTRRALLLACLLTGCAGTGGRVSPADQLVAARPPLAPYAAEHVIALPVQELLGGDSLGWSRQIRDPRRFLASVDTVIEATLRARGLGTTWAFPSDLAHTARRNPTYATDPRQIRAAAAVRYMEGKRDAQIPEPVASQLRTLVGFHDARRALVPVDLRFVADPAGRGGHAVLHVAVLDVRGSRLEWDGEVAGDGAAEFTPQVVATLAERLADLLVPR
jgi:hypothetical protein